MALQKVQEISLKYVDDPQFLQEQYEMLGFTVKRTNSTLTYYWGRPDKPKKEEKPEKVEHKPGQEKTARRLGR